MILREMHYFEITINELILHAFWENQEEEKENLILRRNMRLLTSFTLLVKASDVSGTILRDWRSLLLVQLLLILRIMYEILAEEQFGNACFSYTWLHCLTSFYCCLKRKKCIGKVSKSSIAEVLRSTQRTQNRVWVSLRNLLLLNRAWSQFPLRKRLQYIIRDLSIEGYPLVYGVVYEHAAFHGCVNSDSNLNFTELREIYYGLMEGFMRDTKGREVTTFYNGAAPWVNWMITSRKNICMMRVLQLKGKWLNT